MRIHFPTCFRNAPRSNISDLHGASRIGSGVGTRYFVQIRALGARFKANFQLFKLPAGYGRPPSSTSCRILLGLRRNPRPQSSKTRPTRKLSVANLERAATGALKRSIEGSLGSGPPARIIQAKSVKSMETATWQASLSQVRREDRPEICADIGAQGSEIDELRCRALGSSRGSRSWVPQGSPELTSIRAPGTEVLPLTSPGRQLRSIFRSSNKFGPNWPKLAMIGRVSADQAGSEIARKTVFGAWGGVVVTETCSAFVLHLGSPVPSGGGPRWAGWPPRLSRSHSSLPTSRCFGMLHAAHTLPTRSRPRRNRQPRSTPPNLAPCGAQMADNTSQHEVESRRRATPKPNTSRWRSGRPRKCSTSPVSCGEVLAPRIIGESSPNRNAFGGSGVHRTF